jgi:hypothetical protein
VGVGLAWMVVGSGLLWCPWGVDMCRGAPVGPGWKIPARTGAYGLVLRRRSGTRLAWWQGRLCPSKRDSAARRRGPAAIRFFHPGFLRGQQPSEPRPPWLVPPIKPMRGKDDTRRGYDGGCRSQRDSATDALATTGGSRPTSPARDECVCSRACRALDPPTLSALSRTVSLLAGHPPFPRGSGVSGRSRPADRHDRANIRSYGMSRAGAVVMSVGSGHVSGAAGRAGVEGPCTHGNIRTRPAPAK